jgi:hypothetical protein
MSNRLTAATYNKGLASRGLDEVIESCGLSRDKVGLLLSAQRGSTGNAELQFVKTPGGVEHLRDYLAAQKRQKIRAVML